MPITPIQMDETAIKIIIDMIVNSKNEDEFIDFLFSEESAKNPTIKHIQAILMDNPEDGSTFIAALFSMYFEGDKKEKNTPAKNKPKTNAKPHLRIV